VEQGWFSGQTRIAVVFHRVLMPDGFAWEVAWNPAWKIAADGSIEFH
jgi:type IV secretory pathway VirB10-like protein